MKIEILNEEVDKHVPPKDEDTKPTPVTDEPKKGKSNIGVIIVIVVVVIIVCALIYFYAKNKES